MEKQLIPGLEQELYLKNLKHPVIPESKGAMKDYWGSCQKDLGAHLNKFPPVEDEIISVSKSSTTPMG